MIAVITQSDSAYLNSYSNQFNIFMTMYRFPVVLGTNYMKNFLKIGNITKVNAQIKAVTNSMLINAASPLTMLTLFDKNLNQ